MAGGHLKYEETKQIICTPSLCAAKPTVTHANSLVVETRNARGLRRNVVVIIIDDIS